MAKSSAAYGDVRGILDYFIASEKESMFYEMPRPGLATNFVQRVNRFKLAVHNEFAANAPPGMVVTTPYSAIRAEVDAKRKNVVKIFNLITRDGLPAIGRLLDEDGRPILPEHLIEDPIKGDL